MMISACLIVSRLSFAQTPNTEVELRVAAIRAVYPAGRSEHFVLVASQPAEEGMTALAALQLGTKTRACAGHACSEIVGRDTVAVHAEPVRVTDSTAIVVVDSWVRVVSRREGDRSFGNRYKVYLRKTGNTWRVVEVTPQFES